MILGSKITNFMGVGLTLMFVGITWQVFDAVLDVKIIPKYWISTVWLDFMQIEWNVIPTFLLILGIILIVMGSGKHHRGGME